jgi:hypothetical protein
LIGKISKNDQKSRPLVKIGIDKHANTRGSARIVAVSLYKKLNDNETPVYKRQHKKRDRRQVKIHTRAGRHCRRLALRKAAVEDIVEARLIRKALKSKLFSRT